MKYCRKEPPHDLVEAVQVRDTNIREIRALAKDKLVNYGIDRLGRWVEISTGPKGKTDQAGLGEREGMLSRLFCEGYSPDDREYGAAMPVVTPSRMRLFLDIDGVLNRHQKDQNGLGIIECKKAKMLNEVLFELPEIKIVLSSAWRYMYKFDTKAIECALVSYGLNCDGKVEGCTRPDSEQWSYEHPSTAAEWDVYGKEERAKQVYDYNSNDIEPVPYIVLDDLNLINHKYYIDKWKFVKTNPDVGLTPAKVSEIIIKFLKQTGAKL